MSTTTSNYNLIKPDQEEFYNVDISNDNMDIIDTQIKTISDNLVSHKAETATETQSGHVELATVAETTAGIDNARAVHPAGLKVELDKKIPKTLLSAKGDILYASSANTPAKLAIGSTGQYLKVKADGTIEWGELNLIQPTQLKTADLCTFPATTSTWYTLLNVTSGKGILNRLSANNGASNSITQLEVRVTIDGVQYLFNPSADTGPARGFYRGSSFTSFDFFGPLFFNSSIKVEVMTKKASNEGVVNASVDYGLV